MISFALAIIFVVAILYLFFVAVASAIISLVHKDENETKDI